MPQSKEDREFADCVVNAMQIIGPVYSKRIFGGYGIFLEGLMFALIDKRTLYFKVDKDTEPYFNELGLEAFTYLRQGKTCQLAYRQAPEEALEESAVMSEWANRAYSTAINSAAKSSKNSKEKKKK